MINTAAFRAKIEKHIADSENNHAQRLADWDAFVAKDKTRWVAQYGGPWSVALRVMAKKLKDGEPITDNMVPRSITRYRELEVWSEPSTDDKGRSRPEKVYRVPGQFTQLLDALELLNEPEVSPTSLSRVGITGALMAQVSSMLARRP